MPDETPQTAIATIQAVMRDAQALGKGERNAQQGFNFRGVDAVMNLIGPLLRKHGAFIVPELVSHRYETAQQEGKRGPQYVTRSVVTVAYHWHGPDGSTITGTVAGEAFDYGDKATSKAMSVAFRTYLLQTLTLPTNEPDPTRSRTGTTSLSRPRRNRFPARPRRRRARPGAPSRPTSAATTFSPSPSSEGSTPPTSRRGL